MDDDAPDGGDGSKEHPFNKIQDAIDDVPEGGTIYVFNGTYYENVVMNKTVSLIGNGSANTTIDGGGSGDVVRIEADWYNVSGFMIKHGKRGLLVSSDNNTISQLSITDTDDVGIYLDYTNYNTIENCTINSTGWSGILGYGASHNRFNLTLWVL